MLDARVSIVLATCEGEAFLPELLASIRRQSHENWTLLAGDDCSSDGTRHILEEAAAADRRIMVLDDVPARLGANGNFARLLQEAQWRGADYVLPADQDDVWHVDKIARQVEALKKAAAHGAVVPQLVFCDAAVIDVAGRPLHDSFLRQNRLPYHEARPLATLLARGFVLGCTCALNRALLELALPLPASIASHDWWLALCAAAAGEIHRLDVPLVDYRRHGVNASQPAIWHVFKSRGWRQRWQIGWNQFVRSLDQARALGDRLRERQIVGGAESELLDAFCRIIDEPRRFARLRQLRRLGLPAIGGLRRVLYDACMLIK